ncbi:AarF/ABC1/UbiB kinase family protein [Cyanobacterium stanieri LEGE 03274]|uniref:AarF/ABC1/UbiB kinase family protein n=1 Tax=Cyanobacterium stanieri LEGE 03274 TaxID=1828756 RepID=A0ABR9V7S2_9CHRO|nr:AarF/ABC1/UbiB kinase family protein [Cyanobacterium stanieri LEGE 03274]
MSSAYPNTSKYLESSPEIPTTTPRNKPEAGKKVYRWNSENYSPLRRRIDIWTFVLLLLFKLWRNGKKWSYSGGYSEEKLIARRRIQAGWIRENLLELGPTFIKVGQLFSTRADLFPEEYVEELSKLQDRVPAFSYEQVCAIIEKDFNKPLNKLFLSFDPTPLAAASLGQVHKAQLITGQEVVVKIQRPGLPKLFDIDLGILKQIARYFQNHPRWGKNRDWLGIYDECCRILWQETDYLLEGTSADTFRRNFRDETWVKVPRVFWRYSSPRVLTLEYMPGIKISHYDALEAAGLDRKELARLSAKAYLIQLLNDGFFHADPHPGNLAVDPDGALIFYDFGMMGQLPANIKEKLLEMLFGVTEKNAERVVDSLVELGALAPMDDPGPIRRSVQFLLDNFMDKPFEEQSIGQISEDLYEIAYDQPFRFPATFTFVMRAFSTLEGVGKGLDPDFNFMQVAQPFALNVMSQFNADNGKSIIDEFSRQALQVSNTAFGLPARLDDTINKLDRGDIRLRVRSLESERLLRRISSTQMATNYTLIISTLVLSATILVVNSLWQVAIALGFVAILPTVSLLKLLKQIKKLDRKF